MTNDIYHRLFHNQIYLYLLNHLIITLLLFGRPYDGSSSWRITVSYHITKYLIIFLLVAFSPLPWCFARYGGEIKCIVNISPNSGVFIIKCICLTSWESIFLLAQNYLFFSSHSY